MYIPHICIYIYDIRWSGRGLVFGKGIISGALLCVARSIHALGVSRNQVWGLGFRALDILGFSLFRV